MHQGFTVGQKFGADDKGRKVLRLAPSVFSCSQCDSSLVSTIDCACLGPHSLLVLRISSIRAGFDLYYSNSTVWIYAFDTSKSVWHV